MRVLSLQSGSNGNCICVEAAGRRLLFDAGISGTQAQQRLAMRGGDIRKIDGVFLSHDHSDHTRCAGVYHRKFHLPIYLTAPTHDVIRKQMGKVQDVRFFRAGGSVELGEVTVRAIPTAHDAADGVGFIVEAEGRKLGILTDLGHIFAGLADVIADLDGVLLESNYDPQMLQSGPYPWHLKQRIRGGSGHLSNFQAAELLAECYTGKLKWACLGHLSEENNEPRLALETHREIVPSCLPLYLASRYEPSDWLTL